MNRVRFMIYRRVGNEVRVRQVDTENNDIGNKVMDLLHESPVISAEAWEIDGSKVVAMCNAHLILEVWANPDAMNVDKAIAMHPDNNGFRYVRDEGVS